LKQPPSGGPSHPPALTRSERISTIALARKSGNIQTQSLGDAPRPTVVLTPSAPVSGENRFEVYLGCLSATTDSATGRITPCATISGESESCFFFRLSVTPGKTYLADFLVSADPGPWSVSGGGTQAEINSADQHLLVGLRAVGQRVSLTLRKPNNANGVLATFGPAFFKLELTQID
jgi:hypothetical protein